MKIGKNAALNNSQTNLGLHGLSMLRQGMLKTLFS